MLSNKLKLFFLGILGFFAGCSKNLKTSASVQNAFETFGGVVTNLLFNDKVVLGLMFSAMIVGTFAMFKGLLRFSFSKGFGDSTFGKKEINVIALMLAVIGTSGMFYIFKDEPSAMIHYLGGSVGLLFILFLCVMIMQFFLEFAKSFENPDGPLGKGVGWIFIMIIGTIFALFLLVGYCGVVLEGLVHCHTVGAAAGVLV